MIKKHIFAALSVVALLGACSDSEEEAKIMLAKALQAYDQAITAPDASAQLAGLTNVQAMLDQLVADYPTSEVGLKLAAKENFGQLVPVELPGLIAELDKRVGIESCFTTISAYCILVTATEVQARAFDIDFETAFAAIPNHQKILARILDANVATLAGDSLDPAALSGDDHTTLLANLLIRGHNYKFINFLTAYPQAASVSADLTTFIDTVENKPRLLLGGGALGLPVIGAMNRLMADFPDEVSRLFTFYPEDRRVDNIAASDPVIENIKVRMPKKKKLAGLRPFPLTFVRYYTLTATMLRSKF